ncbi:MAG: hypothetical protein ACOZJX_13565 [Pseudomonadota bacterium]
MRAGHLVLDVLAQHLDLRVVERLVRRRGLDLRDQVLRAGMLHLGLVEQVLILGQGLAENG